MKLLYTDIRNPLTKILSKEASELASSGKRVFYIAPNSLSFEKERSVLEELDQQASFAITVTRFTQMARYFVLNDLQNGQTLDDIGLGMLFYKVLASMDNQDLKVYGRLKKDSAFIQQLVDLYHELQEAHMTFADLEYLETPEKREDLLKIFETVEIALVSQQFDSSSKLALFMEQIKSSHLDEQLAQTALVIDGFTRFSAEEDYLIKLLHQKEVEIIIGVYASQKAYQSALQAGNLYQASLDFLGKLAEDFAVKPQYIKDEASDDSFGKISKLLESRYDFTETALQLDQKDKEKLQIWTTVNQKEELDFVAKSIRQQVHDGYRYKDIRVLLGDVEAYRLQLATIFEQYQIPYYLGRSESMASHPLVHFVESLERIKRYNFRTDDLLNFLKTGLYGQFSQADIDLFEQYVRYADIAGRAKFSREFTHNHGHKFDLKKINRLRQEIMTPLEEFFKARPQSAQSLLVKFTRFLEEGKISQNLMRLLMGEKQLEQEKHEQVWKAFSHILEQLSIVFAQEKLAVDDFLALIQSGMLLSDYRTVPATLDVVTVQSYDLVEPMVSPLVYALGLTQDYFPKLAQNKSLLSDEERERLNQETSSDAELVIASQENLKKNHFAALSLINAATEQLVLSAPQLVNESEGLLSPYLLELEQLGIGMEQKNQRDFLATSDDIGTYRALLSRLIELNQEAIEREWSKEEQTFWSVAVRVLRKKLAAEGIQIPAISKRLESQPLSAETLETLYPTGKILPMSASSLTEFYKNQYSYFLKYVLTLQEELSIHPDARSHGNFLHRIFEKVMRVGADSQHFDARLEQAIAETSQEEEFQAIYEETSETRFARELLLENAKSTAHILKDQSTIEVLGQETVFGKGDEGLIELAAGRQLNIRGKIDRLDRLKLDGSLGVVDYKSGDMDFDFKKFYNGLNSQLITYLQALQHSGFAQENPTIFGAMYLHMQDPIVALKDTRKETDILKEAMKDLKYKGLFSSQQSAHLPAAYATNKAKQFNETELTLLIAYNVWLYRQAAQKILQGSFAINPYTENGRSIAPYVDQHKAITGFEANLHLGQARFLRGLDLGKFDKKPTGEKLKQAWLDKIGEDLKE